MANLNRAVWFGVVVAALMIPVSAQAQAASADQTAVRRVVVRDSAMDGALYGLGAGIAATWVFTRSNCGPAGYDPECAAITNSIGMLTLVPSGVAIGWLIDRLHNKTVDPSTVLGAKPSVAIAPMLSKTTRGVGMSVGF